MSRSTLLFQLMAQFLNNILRADIFKRKLIFILNPKSSRTSLKFRRTSNIVFVSAQNETDSLTIICDNVYNPQLCIENVKVVPGNMDLVVAAVACYLWRLFF